MEGEDKEAESEQEEQDRVENGEIPNEGTSPEVIDLEESSPPTDLPEEVPSPQAEVSNSPAKTPSDSRSKSKSVISEPKKSGSVIKSSSIKSPASERKTSLPSGGSGKTSSRKIPSDVVEGEKEPTNLSTASTGAIRGSLGGGGTPTNKENETNDKDAFPVAPAASTGGVAVFRAASVPNDTVFPPGGGFPCPSGLLQKRSPFIHNPPQPEERRARIACPRTPKEYIINLREDLADFQESHGLPRTRDYSFLSLGLALAQETGRAIYSVFLMFTELFPILAIISLILRFALDKLIEILETTETVPRIKKSVIFALEMLAIMIPLWILVGTIIIPLITLLFSIFKRMLRIKGGKKKVKAKAKVKSESCGL